MLHPRWPRRGATERPSQSEPNGGLDTMLAQSLARGIRATYSRRPPLAAITLAAVATSALTPATTHAWVGSVNGVSELTANQSLGITGYLQSPNGKWRLTLKD